MASKKLQTEVERTLKKVTEGMAEYDQIWNDMEEAATLVKKEKLEAELKKKIKQLQRFRDSIKGWIGNDAVQDDENLIRFKKEIESRMESFKRCERQTKTKAYSKEALASHLTRTELLTPEQKELKKWMEGCRKALEQQLSEMNKQVDAFERKRTKRRKKGDDDNMSDVQNRIKKHEWHLKWLADIWEKVKGGVCNVELVEEMIKDELDYYVSEAHLDRDWPDNDYFYEVFENVDRKTGKQKDDEIAELYGLAPVENTDMDLSSAGSALSEEEAEEKKSSARSRSLSKKKKKDGGGTSKKKKTKTKTKKSGAIGSKSSRSKLTKAKSAKLMTSSLRKKGGAGAESRMTLLKEPSPTTAGSRRTGLRKADESKKKKKSTRIMSSSAAALSLKSAMGSPSPLAAASRSDSNLKKAMGSRTRKSTPTAASHASVISPTGSGLLASGLKFNHSLLKTVSEPVVSQLSFQKHSPHSHRSTHTPTRASSSKSMSVDSSDRMQMMSMSTSASVSGSTSGMSTPSKGKRPHEMMQQPMYRKVSSSEPRPRLRTDAVKTEGGFGPSYISQELLQSSISGVPTPIGSGPKKPPTSSGGSAHTRRPPLSIVGSPSAGISVKTAAISAGVKMTLSSTDSGSGGVSPLLPETVLSTAKSGSLPSARIQMVTPTATAATRKLLTYENPFKMIPTEKEKIKLSRLAKSFQNVPDTRDIIQPVRHRTWLYSKTPASFPKEKASVLDTTRMFKHFGEDTLFLIFYFQVGTFAQMLCGRELTERGWAFHTRMQTWFHRYHATAEELRRQQQLDAAQQSAAAGHTAAVGSGVSPIQSVGNSSLKSGAESSVHSLESGSGMRPMAGGTPHSFDGSVPEHTSSSMRKKSGGGVGSVAASDRLLGDYVLKHGIGDSGHVIEDGYEKGSYVYFDFEKWQQRIKTDFTFEYEFLETMCLDENAMKLYQRRQDEVAKYWAQKHEIRIALKNGVSLASVKAKYTPYASLPAYVSDFQKRTLRLGLIGSEKLRAIREYRKRGRMASLASSKTASSAHSPKTGIGSDERWKHKHMEMKAKARAAEREMESSLKKAALDRRPVGVTRVSATTKVPKDSGLRHISPRMRLRTSPRGLDREERDSEQRERHRDSRLERGGGRELHGHGSVIERAMIDEREYRDRRRMVASSGSGVRGDRERVGDVERDRERMMAATRSPRSRMIYQPRRPPHHDPYATSAVAAAPPSDMGPDSDLLMPVSSGGRSPGKTHMSSQRHSHSSRVSPHSRAFRPPIHNSQGPPPGVPPSGPYGMYPVHDSPASSPPKHPTYQRKYRPVSGGSGSRASSSRRYEVSSSGRGREMPPPSSSRHSSQHSSQVYQPVARRR